MVCVVWIRRSFREFDNTALVEASRDFDEVLPLYVVDKDYFESQDLGYPRVRFWKDSLESFKKSLKENGKDLVVRSGRPVEIVEEVVEEVDADALYFNRDYSPYSRRRDERVGESLDIEVESFKDLVMFEKQEILTGKGEPYSVYSYYRDKWFDREKRAPSGVEEYSVPSVESTGVPGLEELGFERPEGFEWVWNASRSGGLERLEEFKEVIESYDEERDYPSRDSTSRLSPHLKFGTVSVREVFQEAEKVKESLSDVSGVREWQEELAWRDFYFQMLWNSPETVEKAFLEKYRPIDWRSREEASGDWERFVEGRTGFPFVDAGMRQLKETGWMHNRLRMVVTSFACKDLWLDWRDLHSYFSRMFVDAELSAMVGGIQWAYSIGTDAQPYFRVFNPWTQGERYDPDGDFIREKVPELADVPDKYIHRPQEMPEDVQKESNCIIGEDYPEPVVDHSERREEAVSRFEEHS